MCQKQVVARFHPKLLSLLQRCWDSDPTLRPSFEEIVTELESISTADLEAYERLTLEKEQQRREQEYCNMTCIVS